MNPISKDIKTTQSYMKEQLGVGISYDIGFRELIILKTKIQIYYINGLVDDSTVSHVIKELVDINDHESNRKKTTEIIKNRLINLQVETVKTMDESIDQLLSGLIVLFIDGEEKSFVIDLRKFPGRTPEEPDTERVVRGSRDGYTENVVENSALTRRRIRDTRLRQEMLKVGERSKTDVCVSYIKDIANDDLIKQVKEMIQAIEVDGITMTDKALEEFFVKKQKWNPYPLVRYSERPDVVANHLLEGHLAVIVDTSPSVMIMPTTIFDHLEHAEEYRQTPAIGTFIRWIRILAFFSSIYLVPLWLLFVLDPTLLPKGLEFIGPSEDSNIPIVLQTILAFVGVEFLRMAAIHTPTPLATALGLIAAVLIGEIAIDVGLLSAEVILYVSLSTIGTYVTPSYELSVANKLLMLFLIVLTSLFQVQGFMIGFIVNIIFLAKIKFLNIPYLWPFIPFNAQGMLNFVIRIPVPLTKRRPIITHPKDIYNQPLK